MRLKPGFLVSAVSSDEVRLLLGAEQLLPRERVKCDLQMERR
jgi:hypothetical protein